MAQWDKKKKEPKVDGNGNFGSIHSTLQAPSAFHHHGPTEWMDHHGTNGSHIGGLAQIGATLLKLCDVPIPSDYLPSNWFSRFNHNRTEEHIMPLNGRIDLRSDTVTQPCEQMLKAMVNAPLGDDVLGDDPTVHQLEMQIAEMLGKEDAVFVPSGTMSNQIALWIQSKRGDSVALQKDAHIYVYEAAGPAVLSGLLLHPIAGDNGIMDTNALQAKFPPDDPHFAPLTIVCAEDTANKGGGTVYPLDTPDRIAQIAHANRQKHT